MKVALFVHCFFPTHFYGTETYTLEVARNLQKMGHEPIVVSAIFPGEPRQEELISFYEFEGIPVYSIDKNRLPPASVRDTYYQPQMRAILRGLIVRIKPDIIHVTHLMNHTAVLLEVVKELGIPTVATLTDFFGFCFNQKLETADGSLCRGPDEQRTNCLSCLLKSHGERPGASFLERIAGKKGISNFAARIIGNKTSFARDIIERPDILAKCYESYRAVIAPTKFLRDAYLANGLSAPIHLIHFGIDLPRQPKPLRQPGTAVRFGFIGQIAPHKGTDLLVDAFCELPKGAAELHIYGPEDQSPSYMTRLKEKADAFSISFHGTFPKENMLQILQSIDFLVIPSRWYENSPLVLLNSLASHTPVIVSDVAGMTEFVENGKNGYVFQRGDKKDLERVLKYIVSNPDVAGTMSNQTEYPKDTRTMTEELLRIYQEALS